MRVGIPRGLFFYHLYPQWKTFFNYLDWEVATSPPTNKKMVEAGVMMAVSGLFPGKGALRSCPGAGGQELITSSCPPGSIERQLYLSQVYGNPDMLRANPGIPPDRPVHRVSRNEGPYRSWIAGPKMGLKPGRVRKAWNDSTRAARLEPYAAGAILWEGIAIWEGKRQLNRAPVI